MTTLLDFILLLSPLIHVFHSFLEHNSTILVGISMVDFVWSVRIVALTALLFSNYLPLSMF